MILFAESGPDDEDLGTASRRRGEDLRGGAGRGPAQHQRAQGSRAGPGQPRPHRQGDPLPHRPLHRGAGRAVRVPVGGRDGPLQRGLAPPGDLRERHRADVRGHPARHRLHGRLRADPGGDEGLDNRLKLRTPTPVPIERLALSPGPRLHPVAGRRRAGGVDRSCAPAAGGGGPGLPLPLRPAGDGRRLATTRRSATGPSRSTTILRDHADTRGARAAPGEE